MKRFWDKVNKGYYCWNWIATINNKGYGQFWFDNKLVYAHRYSYFIKIKKWPKKCILHKCDNPKCVNPSHLFEGTLSENSQDMVKKLRNRGGFKDNPPVGSKNYNSSITEIIVKGIKDDLNLGIRNKDICIKYGVSKYIVSKIKNKIIWNHVSCEENKWENKL